MFVHFIAGKDILSISHLFYVYISGKPATYQQWSLKFLETVLTFIPVYPSADGHFMLVQNKKKAQNTHMCHY